jgi:uncharacterized protein (TIGR00725 family)
MSTNTLKLVRRACIGVIGAGVCDAEIAEKAFEVGRAIAQEGAVLLCGGLGGVMEAAARGAKSAGGLTIGILPGPSAEDANPYIDVPIVTDMGHARNVILVRSCDAVIAVAGGFGTLSEIAVACKIGIPCVGLATWRIAPEVCGEEDPAHAVALALQMARQRGAV